MDRDKLIEAIRLAIARVLDFKTDKRELELLADHLIANGMGNITTKTLNEAYAEIKELQDFKTEVSTILGTTRKPMLEEIRELKHTDRDGYMFFAKGASRRYTPLTEKEVFSLVERT